MSTHMREKAMGGRPVHPKSLAETLCGPRRIQWRSLGVEGRGWHRDCQYSSCLALNMRYSEEVED